MFVLQSSAINLDHQRSVQNRQFQCI